MNSDEVAALEVVNAYYVLEGCEHFVDACDKVLEEYSYIDWDHCFYVLWVTGRTESFQRIVQIYHDDILQSPEALAQRIQEERYRPVLDLHLYPEYSCFLIDCDQHTL